MLYLLKGFVIGIMVAVPIGPVGLLCIRRTIMHGRLSGQVSGFGAATAHSLYGLAAGLGLAAVSNLVIEKQALVGGIFLCFLGIKTFYTKTVHKVGAPQKQRRLQNYFSTLALAATNPLTILSFVGIFAGLNVQNGNYASLLLLVSGIFLGSISWWLTLTFTVSLFRHRVNPDSMRLLNRVSGVLIFLFGLQILVKI